MKRLLLSLLAALVLATSFAQLNGTGYYRVKNYGSQRYIYVCDGTSTGINMSTTSADMGAIQTWKDLDKAITDPASVIYAKNIGGTSWDLKAQGTGVYDLISYYVNVTELSNKDNIYQVSATASGQTMFLFDAEQSNAARGRLGTGGGSSVPAKFSRWQVYGIDPASDNYVAVAPSINVNGKYYAPYYVSFPFSFYSSGMRTYYVTKIDKARNLVVIKELTGIVPSSTPVIVESGTSAVASNKLKLEAYESYNNRPSDNILKGVYFSNQYRESAVAYKEYDKNTMRILGKTSSGKLGYITATNAMLHNCGDSDEEIWCLNANISYLTVENGTAAELTIVTEKEYDEMYNKKVSSVTLSQSTLALRIGESSTLTATVAPADAPNKTLVWSSSNTDVATVNNGVVTAKAVGTATISAKTTDGSNITANCQVTVSAPLVASITLSRTSAEVKEGESFQLTATVLPENAGSKAVSWKSSNTAVATVDANGKVTAVKAGNADITATSTDGTNISAKCSVKVNPILAASISLDKTAIEDVHGKQVQLTATVLPANASNKNITWSTDNANVATVSNGLVTLVAAGNATITAKASDGSGVSATCTVKVNPILVGSITLSQTTASLYEGEALQLTASVNPENADNRKLVWSSTDNSIATVDESGNVKAIKAGVADITATAADGSGKSATCSVTVNPVVATGISLDITSIVAECGKTVQLTATVLPENTSNKNVVWSTSNAEVATVDNGLVTVVSVGEATVTVATTDGSNLSATCSVKVNPILASGISLDNTTAELLEGEVLRLTATVVPSNAETKVVSWKSSDNVIATVAADGTVTALKAGKAEITATTTDGTNLSATCSITVKPIVAQSITLDKTSIEDIRGTQVLLTATVGPDNTSNKAVVWSSSDDTVASVADGLVTLLSVGEATITAKTADGSDLTATCTVTVKPIFATGITLDKTSAEMDEGETLQLTASVQPENADNKSVEWLSADTAIATVDENGLVTALGQGETEITARTKDGSDLSATCKLIVYSTSGISTVNISAMPEGTKYFTTSGQALPSARKGLVIAKYPNGRKTKVYIK